MKHLEKAALWYFSKEALPYWSILIIDCLLLLLSDFFGAAITMGPLFLLQHFWQFTSTFLFYMIFYVIAFRIFHTYAGVFRFSSFVDLKKVGFAMLTGLACSLAFQFIVNPSWLITLRLVAMVLSMVVATLLMWGIRIWVKGLYDDIIHQKRTVRCFIYGVRQGGVALAKSINSQEESPFLMQGFVSDCDDMVGKRLLDIPVYPNGPDLVDKMKKLGANVLVVSLLRPMRSGITMRW